MINSYRSEDCCCDTCSIRETLAKNVGKVVIVYTTTGGCAGQGFTGLVATVCDDSLKLITTIPSAPNYPFNGNHCRGRNSEFNLCNNQQPSAFGSAVIIPLCHITSVVTAEV